jgi:hypothetical protein
VGGPLAWGLGGGVTTLPLETQYLLRITTHSLGTGRITWHNLSTGTFVYQVNLNSGMTKRGAWQLNMRLYTCCEINRA